MAQRRKAFHFDLDEEKLKALYPSDSENGYKKAWSKIGAFMEANGFEHAQYSGYESVHGMSYYDAFAVLENLQAAFPWFNECAQAATLTEIGRRYDVLEHLSRKREPEEKAPEQRQVRGVSLRSEAEKMRRASKALEDAGLAPPVKAPRKDER